MYPKSMTQLTVLKPYFLYGTAWKEERTADCVRAALESGFRAIDTANQKKHYREDYMGEALKGLFEEGLDRKTLFLQSKYTYQRGQDHRLPYDPVAPISEQVLSSFESSLKNLHTDYLDSYLLHGPHNPISVSDQDFEAWKTMEGLFENGKTKSIGLSNVSLNQLKSFCDFAKVMPSFVQNRCYANRGWDKGVREFCKERGIVYQGFSLLTANPEVLNHPRLQQIAQQKKQLPQQIIFRFCLQIGMLPITGTTNPNHMKEDLGIFSFELSSQEVSEIEELGLS